MKVRDPNTLYVSATQVTTWLSCERKWWLTWPAKMPLLPSKAQADGTILHSVLERWLGADRLGRDPKTGAPVELYPAGWDVLTERGVTHALTEPEKARVRNWVTEAERTGVLQRGHTQAVEHEFELPVIPGAVMTGKIDHMRFDGVEDHKTSKLAKYLKQPGPDTQKDPVIYTLDQEGVSPNCVGTEPQMLIYGYVWFDRNPLGGILSPKIPEQIRLSHNQFLKEAADRPVRKATATVSTTLVEDYWINTVEPVVQGMLELAKVKDWAEVERRIEGPTEKGACMAYGGCPFRGICGKTELPATYKTRVELFIANKSKSLPLLGVAGGTITQATNTAGTEEQQDMGDSIFAKRRAAQAAQGGQPTPTSGPAAPAPLRIVPVAVEPPPATTMRAAAPAPVPAAGAAPWADPNGCRACGSTGINSNQQPCRICNAEQAKNGGVTSAHFYLAHDADGKLVWEPMNGAPAARTAPAVATSPSALADALAPAPSAPAPKRSRGRPRKDGTPAQPTQIASPDQSEKELDAAAEAPVRAALAPKQAAVGFALLINAVWCKGPDRAVVLLSDVMRDVGNKMAVGAGAPDFYSWDAFKRRDALAAAAPKIAELLGSSVVLASGGDPDSKVLITALEPLAAIVIRGAL